MISIVAGLLLQGAQPEYRPAPPPPPPPPHRLTPRPARANLAALFTAGKFLLGLYLGRSDTASTYGAAGALVLVLMWVYYSSQILFFGAEFTKVWTRWRGHGFAPEKSAEAVTDEARAEQGLARTRR